MATEYRSREAHAELVGRFELLGITAKEFCRREGLNYWTFCNWRRRLRQERAEQPLVQIKPLQPVAPSGTVTVRMSLAEVMVEVECGAEEDQVAAVLRAARSLSC